MPQQTIDQAALIKFLGTKARSAELEEFAKILKLKLKPDAGWWFRRKELVPALEKKTLAKLMVQKLYRAYQTPIGYLVKKPTLDAMCERIAKKLKLSKLEGVGWQKLHSFSVGVFEKILKALPKKEKEKLLKQMWHHLNAKDKKDIRDEFHVADVNQFIHSSELMVAHVVGVHLARETALYTAAAILRIGIGAELALAASTVLTRTATIVLGPVGWALLAVSVNDLLGTNYKQVVPVLLAINVVSLRAHRSISRTKLASY